MLLGDDISGCHGAVLGDTPLQHGMVFRDGAFGLVDQSGSPSFQEGRPTDALQPQWDQSTYPLRESILQNTLEKNLSDIQTSDSGGKVLASVVDSFTLYIDRLRVCPVHMYFTKPCPLLCSAEGAVKIRGLWPLLKVVLSLNDQSRTLVRIATVS